jgi:hypothetical protein
MQTKVRAPRVRVPNEEPVSFTIQDKRVSATLQKISMTGGLAQLNKDPGRITLAEIRLDTLAGPVRGLVEFLPPFKERHLYSVPFRFIALDEVDQARLKKTLHIMRQQGLGEK